MCYLIGGPTASGKSKLALWLAEHVDGEIINADSLQLYKNIPILSAAPSNHELAQTRHHLFGIYHDDQVSMVEAWVQLAKSTIDSVVKRQKTPIIVGGTGMYLNALTQGISPIPAISKDIKNSVRDLQKDLTKEQFYDHTIKIDPSIEGFLHKNDTQRLGRALEVILATEKSIRFFQGKAKPLIQHNGFIVVMPERFELNQLINDRVIKMLSNGAMQEVQALRQNISLDAPVCKAIGVKEIWRYLANEISKEEMISLLQQTTRQYAKRQMTWFNNQIVNPIVITNPFDPKQINLLVKRKPLGYSLKKAAC